MGGRSSRLEQVRANARATNPVSNTKGETGETVKTVVDIKAITVGRASQIGKWSESSMSDMLRKKFHRAGVKVTPKARKYFVGLLKEHATDPTVSVTRTRNIIKREINLHGAAKIGKTQAQTLKAATLGGQVKGRNVGGEHANFHFGGGIKRTN